MQLAIASHIKQVVLVGVAAVFKIVQRVMKEVLQGIPNVVVYLDDILASNLSEEEHVKLLDEILGWHQAFGLCFHKSKCIFRVVSVIGLMQKAFIQSLSK